MNSYSSKAISNEFLRLAEDEGKKLNQIHIHKFSYLSHAMCLVIYDKPLVNESFYAWPFGPVLISIYREFKDIRKNHINRYSKDGNIFPQISIDDKNSRDIIKKVWNQFKDYEWWELSKYTNNHKSPWDLCFEENNSNCIYNKLIKDYYANYIYFK